MKLLILCEKASAARNFATALGGQTGFFNNDTYKIVHSHGHLLELKDPQDQVLPDKKDRYASWKSYKVFPWNLDDLNWSKKYKKSIDPKTKKIVSTQKDVFRIKQASLDYDAIVIATDNDPSGEGDLLGWEIVNAIGWKKTVYRIRFEDETPNSIKNALQNKVDVTDQMHQGEYLEAVARERFDFASMQLTRITTLAAREQNIPVTVLRVGRLKSVIVELVYNQENKIKNWIKKPFYEIRFKDANNNIFKRAYDELNDHWRFENNNQAQQDLNNYQNSNIEIESQVQKTTAPPSLLDLGKLSILIVKKGYSSQDLLKTYQKMYEASYVSYPRTEDTRITQAQFNELLPLTTAIAKVVNVNPKMLTHRRIRSKHLTKVAAHGANRPGKKVPANLDEIESQFGKIGREIYKVLAKSYLAIMCEDYIYLQQKAHLVTYPAFKATINIPQQYNYKQVFNENALADKTDEHQSQFSNFATPFVYEGSNIPPAKPTQKFIINFLEKGNIGTGATRLKTLADVSNGKTALLINKKNDYKLNDNGLIEAILIQGTMIANPNTTKQLFDYMDQVKTFKVNYAKIPALMTQIINHDMPIIRQNSEKLTLNPAIKTLQAKKQNNVPKDKVEGKSANGTTVKFNTEFMKHKFTADEINKLLNDKTITISVTSKKGNHGFVSGKLVCDQEFNGHKFDGFKPDTGTWKWIK